MVLGIVGILITIIIGLLPIFFSNNEKTIRYWHVETESIFFDKIKEINQLKIFYKDKEINDKIIILKTVIENNGKKDIDKSIVHEPMKINFDDSIELLEVEKIQAPGNVEVQKEDNSIICNWDLLKKREFIILKVLLRKKNKEKIKSDDLLKKHCKLSFRITDLSKPKRINYTNSISKKIDYKSMIIPIIYLVISIFGIFSTKFSTSYSIRYQDNFFDGKNYSIQAKDENNIILKSGRENLVMSVNEYNNRGVNSQLELIKSAESLVLLVLFFILFFLSLVMLVSWIYRINRDKKIHMFFEKEYESA